MCAGFAGRAMARFIANPIVREDMPTHQKTGSPAALAKNVALYVNAKRVLIGARKLLHMRLKPPTTVSTGAGNDRVFGRHRQRFDDRFYRFVRYVRPETATMKHSYYVVMIDYGKRGREAVVDPEITCRGIVDRIKSHEYQNIVFIHRIEDGLVEDVTDELIDAAELVLKEEYEAARAA